jgi:hypothetical protein
VLRFAPGFNTFGALAAGAASAYFLYSAGRFAFHYSEEVLRPVSGKQAAYQHLFLQAHGHVGIGIMLALAFVSGVITISAVWRLSTIFPAAILMPDKLWLHPSFGKRPMPYSNIVGVRLAKIWPNTFSSGQLALIIDMEMPARNRVLWAYFTSPRQVVIRKLVIDQGVRDLARFRNRLVAHAQRARAASGTGRAGIASRRSQ